ncbi:MAG: hypothetical protein IJ500_00510 [Alphaproteobacteria bacterium]|nr:hypothetical protein [Alphaproteobacteria bacterium]
MKKIYDDPNIVIYSKTETDPVFQEIKTSDGKCFNTSKPTIYDLGIGLGAAELMFINPNTGEWLHGGDGEIIPISTKANKVVFNEKVWSLSGLATHLQSKYPESKCPEAQVYDFFAYGSKADTLAKKEREFLEKYYKISIPKGRLELLAEQRYLAEQKKYDANDLPIFDVHKDVYKIVDWQNDDLTSVKGFKWSIDGTKFAGETRKFKEMFKQIVSCLYNHMPRVLDIEMIRILSESDALFNPTIKKIIGVSGEVPVVNGNIDGLEFSNIPNNHRHIDTYTDSMWIEVVPEWLYIWGLYSNNDLKKKLQILLKLYGIEPNMLKISIQEH